MAKRAQKQRQRAQRLLEPLLEQLQRLEAASTLDFLETVQRWLADNLDAFPAEARASNGLDQWVTIALKDHPTMYADFHPVEALASLRQEPPSSIDVVAMWLATLFREGVTIFSRRECPQCESLLRVMQEGGNPEHLGYECDVCTWAEDEDRSEWQAEGILVPATTEALQRRGLLLRRV